MNSSQFFKLLVPANEIDLPNAKTIELCGTFWKLEEFEKMSDAPPYTCISYSWGRGRTRSNLNKDCEISDRTMPVVETVINAMQSTESKTSSLQSMFKGQKLAEKMALVHSASHAIWIDSLCNPQDQPSFDLCVLNMGEIYRNATQVFVVLKSSCTEIVQKMHDKEPLELNDYLAIAEDDWIDRIWTYQEFANSKMMFIVAQDKGDTFISEFQFLFELMNSAEAYEKIDDIDLYLKLERMQLLLAEQQLQERSAFQVMAAMEERSSMNGDLNERINVMISVLSDTTISNNQSLHSPVDHFFNICNKKGDFSYLFTTNKRSTIPGRTWCPVGEQFTPVLSNVLTFGDGVSGRLTDTHLEIDNMCCMTIGKDNPVVRAINTFLRADLPREIFKQLQQLGFTGCGEFMRLEYGYFFPLQSHKPSKKLFVAVPGSLTFDYGAPGLLLRSNEGDIHQYCDTGVFIGKLPINGESINVS